MSSIPRTTQRLAELAAAASAGPALDIGSYSAQVARVIGSPYLHVDLTACTMAERAGAEPVLHSDTVPPGPFASIWFDAREYEPGLALETLAQAGEALAPGGVVYTSLPMSDTASLFAKVIDLGEVCAASRPLPDAYQPVWPVYETEFAGQTYRIESAPGVFSPRALDTGTRLMLTRAAALAAPGTRLLDLGSGTGIVSRIATDGWNCEVTAVDVHARALRLTARNAPQAEVMASRGYTALGDRQFDLILTNPPYHTDFSVAREFIEGAHRHLVIGGSLCVVVKRSDWYLNKVRTIFGGCLSYEAEGYTVLVAQRRNASRQAAPQPAPTTRKHARRLAEAKRKPRRP